MYTAQLSTRKTKGITYDEFEQLFHDLFSAMRMNGQVLGCEWSIYKDSEEIFSLAKIPDKGALNKKYHNEYVKKSLLAFSEKKVSPPSVRILGKEIDSLSPCRCERPKSYILYTHSRLLESPLRCGDCFSPVPLYKIPYFYDCEHYPIICWQSDYQSCDGLQLNCGSLEKVTLMELGNFSSLLSKNGVDICHSIGKLIGAPVYYYFYQYAAKSLNNELKRKCPCCQKEWLLDKPWFNLFDFRCDRCHLLSNIAESVLWQMKKVQ